MFLSCFVATLGLQSHGNTKGTSSGTPRGVWSESTAMSTQEAWQGSQGTDGGPHTDAARGGRVLRNVWPFKGNYKLQNYKISQVFDTWIRTGTHYAALLAYFCALTSLDTGQYILFHFEQTWARQKMQLTHPVNSSCACLTFEHPVLHPLSYLRTQNYTLTLLSILYILTNQAPVCTLKKKN